MEASDKRQTAGSAIVGNGQRRARRVLLQATAVLSASLALDMAGRGSLSAAATASKAEAGSAGANSATTNSAEARSANGTTTGAGLQNSVLVVGDSLSAEYGLKRGSGWVAMMEAKLAAEGVSFVNGAAAASVVNASISGETTAGGWARFPALIERHRPAVVIIALGANDALRGLDLRGTESNLAQMLARVRQSGARAVLVGMMLPPNYGKAYADRFAALYASLAKEYGAALVPFLMAGFAEDLSRFQADRIHPNESAQAQMLANVWPAVASLAGKA